MNVGGHSLSVRKVLLPKSVFVSKNVVHRYYATPPCFVSYTSGLCFCNTATEGNKLIGELPPEMSLFTGLKTLSMTKNFLRGGLDVAFAALTSLEMIAMDDNQLSGTIPPDVFENNAGLMYFTVASNSFTGPIPTGILSATMLNELKLSGNQLTGTIPSEIGQLVQLSKHFMTAFAPPPILWLICILTLTFMVVFLLHSKN
jgi:hypothetical protein